MGRRAVVGGGEAIDHMVSRQKSSPDLIPTEAREYIRPRPARSAVSPSNWEYYKGGDDWPTNYGGDLKTLDVVKLFEGAEMLFGPEHDHYTVRCPWVDEHSGGREVGTAVWPAKDGKFPTFHCYHGHCEDRTIEDVLAWFGRDKVDSCCTKVFGDPVRQAEEVKLRDAEDEIRVAAQ